MTVLNRSSSCDFFGSFDLLNEYETIEATMVRMMTTAIMYPSKPPAAEDKSAFLVDSSVVITSVD